MRTRLVQVTQRPSGAPARREEELHVESLYVGRGTDNDLSLPGLTISLHHATFSLRGDGVWVEVAEAPTVLVNGRPSERAKLAPGDVVRIGSHALRVLEPEEGVDLVLEVEQIEKAADEREQLDSRTRIGIEGGLLTRRVLSWVLALGVLAVFGALPLVSGQQDAWNSGPISNKHAFIQDDCERCHDGFEPVRNDGCLECHYDIESHTADDGAVAGLADRRCAECHVEHNGSDMLADLGEPLCASCHARLEDLVSAPAVGRAVEFAPGGHPEFRLSVVQEPGVGPVLVVWSPDLEERSGLEFDHLRHVGQRLPMPDGSKQSLACGSCHALAADATTMAPVDFETHCRLCHRLTFDDEGFADRDAIHADPVAMRAELSALYSDQVLRAEVVDRRAPRVVRFRRAGQKVTPKEQPIVRAWVEEKVAAASRHLMRDPGECARCHEVVRGAAADGGDYVAPVEVTRVWMPKSRFRHGTHAPFRCRDCHPAVSVFDPEDAPDLPRPAWSLPESRPYALFTPEQLESEHRMRPSTTSADVNLPGIEHCQSCHGGQSAAAPMVVSPCGMCHPFHREEHGPAFSPPPAEAAGVESAEQAHLRG